MCNFFFKRANRVEPTRVRLGDLNLDEYDGGEIDVPIEKFIPHERYNRNNMHNDIAVVKMDRDVTLTKNLRPACLSSPSSELDLKAIASGWYENFQDLSKKL